MAHIPFTPTFLYLVTINKKMGNPLYSDDKGKMCWNAAKSWQVGWYDSNKFTFNQQKYWRGRIVGIADFDDNPSNHPVIIKLETGTTNDLFIAFNRAGGVNSDNREADDEVTIVEAGKDGESYSLSRLKAHLVQGENYQVSNWRGSGKTLTITAEHINITAAPGYALISICMGCTPHPSSIPSKTPTKSPSKTPTKSPSSIPSKTPTKLPTNVPTEIPSIPCTELSTDKFFLKWNKSVSPKEPVFASCRWLTKRKPEYIEKRCQAKMSAGGKGAARDVCVVTCDSCERRFM